MEPQKRRRKNIHSFAFSDIIFALKLLKGSVISSEYTMDKIPESWKELEEEQIEKNSS